MIVVRAGIDTRHFSFEAFAANDEDAKDALRAGLVRHCQQTGIPVARVEGFMQDAQVNAYRLGAAYRDNEEIKS